MITRDINQEEGGRILHGYVNFGSQVGRSEFTVLLDGRPEFGFEIEIFPAKLDYENDYRQILAEVQEILTGLALAYLRATFQLGLGFQTPQPTHVEWLSLLRHVMDELERALRYIAARPVRGLDREPVMARVEKVKRVDASIRSELRRGKGTGGLLQLGGGVRVRERVMERRARPALDTLEHCWIARQLKLIHQRLRRLRAQEQQRLQESSGKGERGRRVICELDRLDERIAALCRLEPLDAAGDTLPPGFVSLQLLAAPGYRETYRALLLLSLGLRLEGGLVRLSVKDLSQLYEYWCYLALVRLIAEATGREIPAGRLFTVSRQGLQVLLQKGRTTSVAFDDCHGRSVKVVYNPRFQGDYVLIPQQPDMLVTLADPDWPVLHLLLDAKYRIDCSPEFVGRYSCPGPPEDALNVMHRYRDAIIENSRPGWEECCPGRTIVQAAAVFPFREQAEGEYRGSLLWQSLARIGIGAVPLLPGDEGYMREWLQTALRKGGWALADQVIDHQARERAFAWRSAAAEPVLVGILRGNGGEEQHLNWIKENNLYYMPLSRTQRRQFAVRHLAVYLPATLRLPGAGAVAYRARVTGIEVVQRKDIPTPWVSSRDGNALQVLYHLSRVRAIENPILNKGSAGRGGRFSTHRWTSRLALERARILEELFLETEPEWRLYEGLRARGITFQIVPGPVKLTNPENPAGRAWFSTEGGLSARYAGASGFLIKEAGGKEKCISRIEDVLGQFEKGT
ncbi:MAG: hypothetical protein BWY80_00159 [Firmicutes bacterium ADurb.Bin456]|nr:MAG: hypothetical protein BWY80_00159 [Firmicutes bacterium ADurb.Bin456]